MPNLPRVWRKWIYSVTLAAVPLAVAFGVLDDRRGALVVGLVGAIVSPALALRNLPEKGE